MERNSVTPAASVALPAPTGDELSFRDRAVRRAVAAADAQAVRLTSSGEQLLQAA